MEVTFPGLILKTDSHSSILVPGEDDQLCRDNLGFFVCLSLTGGRQEIATLFRKPAESWQSSVPKNHLPEMITHLMNDQN